VTVAGAAVSVAGDVGTSAGMVAGIMAAVAAIMVGVAMLSGLDNMSVKSRSCLLVGCGLSR